MKEETNLYNVVSHIFNKKCKKKRRKNKITEFPSVRFADRQARFAGLKISLSPEKNALSTKKKQKKKCAEKAKKMRKKMR